MNMREVVVKRICVDTCHLWVVRVTVRKVKFKAS